MIQNENNLYTLVFWKLTGTKLVKYGTIRRIKVATNQYQSNNIRIAMLYKVHGWPSNETIRILDLINEYKIDHLKLY